MHQYWQKSTTEYNDGPEIRLEKHIEYVMVRKILLTSNLIRAIDRKFQTFPLD